MKRKMKKQKSNKASRAFQLNRRDEIQSALKSKAFNKAKCLADDDDTCDNLRERTLKAIAKKREESSNKSKMVAVRNVEGINADGILVTWKCNATVNLDAVLDALEVEFGPVGRSWGPARPSADDCLNRATQRMSGRGTSKRFLRDNLANGDWNLIDRNPCDESVNKTGQTYDPKLRVTVEERGTNETLKFSDENHAAVEPLKKLYEQFRNEVPAAKVADAAKDFLRTQCDAVPWRPDGGAEYLRAKHKELWVKFSSVIGETTGSYFDRMDIATSVDSIASIAKAKRRQSEKIMEEAKKALKDTKAKTKRFTTLEAKLNAEIEFLARFKDILGNEYNETNETLKQCKVDCTVAAMKARNARKGRK